MNKIPICVIDTVMGILFFNYRSIFYLPKINRRGVFV